MNMPIGAHPKFAPTFLSRNSPARGLPCRSVPLFQLSPTGKKSREDQIPSLSRMPAYLPLFASKPLAQSRTLLFSSHHSLCLAALSIYCSLAVSPRHAREWCAPSWKKHLVLSLHSHKTGPWRVHSTSVG